MKNKINFDLYLLIIFTLNSYKVDGQPNAATPIETSLKQVIVVRNYLTFKNFGIILKVWVIYFNKIFFLL